MAEYLVIGTSKILGVPAGDRVELDPDKYNVPALISGGHIEPAKIRARKKVEETIEEDAQ